MKTDREHNQLRQSPAFTLLEVLLAMAILTVVVLMVVNMFQEVSVAWSIGTRSAEMNTAGRAATEFIANELAQAVAGPIEAAKPNAGYPAVKFLLTDSGKELQFVTLAGDRTNGRALRSSLFRLDPADKTVLQYWRGTAAFDPYAPPGPAWDSAGTFVENVVDFSMVAYPTTNELIQSAGVPEYDSQGYGNKLPVCLDIYVEVLSADDMVKYNQLGGGSKTDFKNRNGRRYTTRVFFNNRTGWQARP
jgi:prepilin-type N-terminal cleavage/methylation domain-containing protein